MKVSTMGRWRKGVGSLLSKACSVVTAACMALTLVPAAAWATAGNGTPVGGDVDEFSSGGSTEITGRVYDESFAFIDMLIPGENFDTIEALDKALEEKPLQAVFNKDGLPEDFTVTWYVTEMTYNEAEAKWEATGEHKALLTTDSSQTSLTVDEDGNPVFSCVDADGKPVSLSEFGLSDNVMYEFSVSLQDKYTGETASIAREIGIYANYKLAFIPSGTIGGEEAPYISKIPGVTAEGYIYRDGSFPNFSIPGLSAAESGKASVSKLNDKAQEGDESVVAAADVSLIYDFTSPTEKGVAPYLGKVSVTIPIPEDLDVYEKDGKPYVMADANTLNVYVLDENGKIQCVTGKVEWAHVMNDDGGYDDLLDEDGNKIAVVSVAVEGTGLNLGTFGVGIPNNAHSMYTITTDAVHCSYGSMVPSGSSAVSIWTAQVIDAYAIAPGYLFDGFTLNINGEDRTADIVAEDVGLNTFTFSPQKYGIVEGDKVVVGGSFSEQDPTVGEHAVTVELVAAEDGVSGSVDVNPTDGSAGMTVNMGGSNRVRILPQEGAILNFAPSTTDPVCYVKSVETRNSDGSMSPVAFTGSMLMIGAFSVNTTIVVTYAKGTPSAQLPVNVHASIPYSYEDGSQPAWLQVGDQGDSTEYSYSVPAGNGITINTKDDAEYDLVEVWVSSSTGWETHFSRYYYSEYQIPSGYTNPDSDTLMRVATLPEDVGDEKTTNTTINLYNIVGDLEVELVYMRPGGGSGGDASGGSGGGSWGDDNSSSKQVRAAAAASDGDEGIATHDEASSGTIPGPEGGWHSGDVRQFTFWADPGYTVVDLVVNGESVINLAKCHEGAGEDGRDLYTLTFYRGTLKPGDAASIGKVFEADGVQDNVYSFTTRYMYYVLYLAPVVVPVEQFYTVSTSVSDFGHGSVTPSKKVAEGGAATIGFFPEEGYKVQSVLVDGVDIYSAGWSETDNVKWMDGDRSAVTISNITANVQVVASFTRGEQPGSDKTRFNVMSSSGAGGSIYPSGSFQVYEGTSETFALIPSTGYEVSTFVVNGEDKLADVDYHNIYTIDGVASDLDVRVTFKKTTNDKARTYTVSTQVNGQGTVSPAGPMLVAAGSDATFTLMPSYEVDGEKWYVREVRAKYASSQPATAPGVNISSLVRDDFTLVLPDIQDDVVIVVTFAQSEDGKYPFTDDPVPDPTGSETWKPDPDKNTVTVEPSENPGAVVTPPLDGEYIKDPETGGIVGPLDFTIIVADGYELDSPLIAGPDGIGGVVVRGGSDGSVISDKCIITEVGEGLYIVTVPGELVTDEFSMVVNTHPKSSSPEDTKMWNINLKTVGNGAITPAGVGNVVSVEDGRSQTFNFIPASGSKLQAVYINGNQVSASKGYYTIVGVSCDMEVEAVFSELEEGETQPVLTTHTVNVVKKTNNLPSDNSGGEFSPSGAVQVVDGANLTISATHKAGVKVSAYIEGGESLVRVGNSFELVNITSDMTVNVLFEPDVHQAYYNFVVKSSGPGTTSPSGSQLVVAGSSQTLYFAPDEGKYLKDVVVNGTSRIGDVSASQMSLSVSNISESTVVVVTYCDDASESKNPDLPAGGSGSSPATFNVTASVEGGVGGAITPLTAKVSSGGDFTLSIVPVSGYELESVTDNGTELSGSVLDDVISKSCYQLTGVAADHVVSVRFKQSVITDIDSYYTVSVGVPSNPALPNNGGTVSPIGYNSVTGGGNFTLTIMPEPNCKVSGIYVGSLDAADQDLRSVDFSGTSYTLFNVSANTKVLVKFAALGSGEQGSSTLTHTIKANSSIGGSISPEGSIKVADGASSTYTFVSSAGYQLSYVRIDGADVHASDIDNNQYTFSGVTSDHTINAVFVKTSYVDNYHTVTAVAGNNGSVSPSGSVLVEDGEDASISIAAHYGYKVSEIEVTVDSATHRLSELGDLAGSINGTAGSVAFAWSGSALSLSGIKSDVEVNAFFVSTYSGDPDQKPSSEYTPVSGGTSVEPEGSGAGGTSSIDGTGYMEDPDNWDDSSVSDKEKRPHVTIEPDEGSMLDKVVINYGDGSKTVIDENGTTDYDADGNVVSGPTPPTALDVQERGWFDYDAERADAAGGVDFDVVFRPATSEEQSKIDSGEIKKPACHEVEVTYTSGGTVFPTGSLKVADGSFLTLQLIPQSGYEIEAVSVDGKSAIDKLTATSKLFVEGDGNHAVHVVFSYTGSSSYYNVSASVSGDGGTVSPDSARVVRGTGVTLNFFPDSGKKIERLVVTSAGVDSSQNYDGEYSLTSYTINNINADYTVTVSYCDIPEGETPWVAPETMEVTATVGNAGGKVTPASQQVAVGSSGTVFFEPDYGHQIDYILFNGIATTLLGNPAYCTVTPQAGKANEVTAYFKQASNEQSYVTVNSVTDGHATAQPQTAIAKTGDSMNVYIYPESGWTVDTVTVNGWTVAARPALPAGSAISSSSVYSAYVVTIDDVQAESGKNYATVNVTTKKTSASLVEVPSHKLTVNGQNALVLSPLGELIIPEGMPVKVITTGITGYYLDSINATEFDADGNQIGDAADLYGTLKGDCFEYTMGSNDTEIFVKYLPVGEYRPSMVNVTLAGAQFKDASGNLSDIDLSSVVIGTALNPDGTVSPIARDENGVLLNSDGEPMEFVRGSNYTFFVSAKDSNGNDLLLVSATYDGAELNVGTSDNAIHNAVLNASGDLRLVFGEGKVEPPVENWYKVWVEVDGEGGSNTGTQEQSVHEGSDSSKFVFTPDGDDWMVESVKLYRYDADGNQMGSVETVDSSLYKDETFILRGVYANTKVVVKFCKAKYVDVLWDKAQGYITPNPITSKLKVPASWDSISFVIAPYDGYYVSSVQAQIGGAESKDVTNQLIQATSAADRLCAQADNVTVVAIDEGAGVVGPYGNSDSPANGDAVAYSSDLVTTAGDLDSFNGVPLSAGSTFARAYAYEMGIGEGDNVLKASFEATPTAKTSYTITATAGEHGTISPSGAVTVAAGADQQFTFGKDEGYSVADVKIDGLSVGARESYTFTSVDRDHTIEVTFTKTQSGTAADRLIKTASNLAKTGDLTGPAIGFFMLIIGLGIGVMAISMIRSKRREQRVR